MPDFDPIEKYEDNKATEKAAKLPPSEEHGTTANLERRKALASPGLDSKTAARFPAEGPLLARLSNPPQDASPKGDKSTQTKSAKLPDKNICKQEVLAAAEKKLTDQTALALFKKDINDIDKRTQTGQLFDSEAARTYQQIYRGLTTNSEVGVSDKNMIILARQIAHEQAHPESIDQGAWNTCHSEAPRVKLSYTNSAAVAKLVMDAAITGKYTDTKGTTVDITKSVQPANAESLEVPPGSNVRSYAGQLFDVVAQNLVLADRNKLKGTKLEYVQKPVNGKDDGARVVDNNNKKTPNEVYSFDKAGNPVCETTPIIDENGDRQLDINLQPMTTTPIDGIGLNVVNSIQIAERIAKKNMAGQAIGHFDQVGQPDNWAWDKVGLATSIQRDWQIPFFKTEADLEKLLIDANNTHKFPLLCATYSGAGKLGEQLAKATGKPIGGRGGLYGGGHLLCITGYDPITKTCSVDNTWGLERDIKSATLKDIVDMSHQPEHLRKEQELLKADIRLAYAQWYVVNNKRFNVDFPNPKEDTSKYLIWARRQRQVQHLPAG